MNTEKILLFMTVNICQCEHCKEIIRQQNRLEKWQQIKNPIVKTTGSIKWNLDEGIL